MDITIIMMEDGSLALAVKEGEYEEASDNLRAFIKTLEMGDIPIITSSDKPEMHKQMQKFVGARNSVRR